MIVINFCGSAGSGKSTAAYGLAHTMKQRYIEIELIDEYAKRLVLAGASHMLADQLKILAEQNSRLFHAKQIRNNVSYVVTDSPLFLSAFYAPPEYPESFKTLVFDMFKLYENVNIFLERNHQYNPVGRLQTEEGSDKDSELMKQMLIDNNISFTCMKAGEHVPMAVMNMLNLDMPPARPLTHVIET